MRGAFYILVFCVGSLLMMGLVMLYSASMAEDGAGLLVSQLKWGGLGLVACLLLASVDYQTLKRFHMPSILFGVAALALILVLTNQFGKTINGSRRWFIIGGQPSEFAKVALIVFLAWYGERNLRRMDNFWRGLAIPGACIGVLVALVFLEPDWGTAMLLAALGGAMLLLAGVRWLHVIPPILAALVVLSFMLWENPVRRERVMAFLHPEEYKEGVGFQTYQAKLALGAGGMTGKGLGNGRQKLGFVPEHHTDFILSVIGEELGVIATLFVVGCFAAIVLCGAAIARGAPDDFGRLLAAGVTFLFGLQAFINIGVVTGSLPNKGISLPFISYGGSNLIAMMISVGILFSVARRAAAVSPAERKLTNSDNIFAAEAA